MRSKCAFGCGEIVGLKNIVSSWTFATRLPRHSTSQIFGIRYYWPQRLHKVCVLLWRFPKLAVPFAEKFVSLESVLSSPCDTYSFWIRDCRRQCQIFGLRLKVWSETLTLVVGVCRWKFEIQDQSSRLPKPKSCPGLWEFLAKGPIPTPVSVCRSHVI